MKQFFVGLYAIFYKYFLKRILFLINPEKVHNKIAKIAGKLGKRKLAKRFIAFFLKVENPRLEQTLFGQKFANPVGLAAGFDYEADLLQLLPSLGFGFGSVGTITNLPYQGNPSPMLGRLPKSKSLMVNKGFKNLGMKRTLEILDSQKFEHRLGISIGKTNSLKLKTQEQAVEDIVSAFWQAEKSEAKFSYYELNISCPNLMGNIEFYSPKHLDELLVAVGSLKIKKPVFVKMPISNSDAEIRAMMRMIIKHPFVKAVIIGNLQKDRKHPALVKEEVAKFKVGNFSGLPCQARSDELIAMVYKEFGKQVKIIGCGGIFSAEDAYRKILNGASLVQLITGLIYEGPQLASQINRGLVKLLEKDGYSSIKVAVGKATK